MSNKLIIDVLTGEETIVQEPDNFPDLTTPDVDQKESELDQIKALRAELVMAKQVAYETGIIQQQLIESLIEGGIL